MRMTDILPFPAEVNFTIECDAYWEIESLCTDNGTPIDFTGCTGRMYLKRAYRDDDPVKEFTTENGRMTLTDDGYIRVNNGGDYSADLSGTYYYDILITETDGKPYKYFKGKVTVNNTVSK